MTNLETVAKQRDELADKNRELATQLEAAAAEIAALKGERRVDVTTLDDKVPVTVVAPIPAPPLVTQQPANRDGSPFREGFVSNVPQASPVKSKRPRIFGGA